MLIYHPAFDASHCTYRILKLFNILEENQYIDADRIKIIDFYIVFPKQIKFIKFPKEVRGKFIRKELENINDTYRPCKNKFLMAKKMSFIQEKVLQSLVINEYLDKSSSSNEYKKGNKFSQLALSLPILDAYITYNVEKLIFDFLLNYSLNGKDGLKDRTALMEFRYDK
ncbi:ABC-three component system middle component 5 [Acinetobacter sp. NIPH 2699]|uniref:ABC-three component system middle component 5 n=1 Tax=Acinetobacter sp. NIPH 2699 TaxID=2923433 RepID=UPI001F4AF002|nr:ABC-three component system middle component 5 [Acinetobacter sp. NIPH 2699]MCH7337106.1 hypothetical protein [Acinetobacter sp. NIPH 2699]